jgi:alpha-tubulin suppressor-like RCC1 family protein
LAPARAALALLFSIGAMSENDAKPMTSVANMRHTWRAATGLRPLLLSATMAAALGTSTVACSGRVESNVEQLGVARGEPLRADQSSIGAGFSFSCETSARGMVACWGANHFGQLGTSASPDATQLTPKLVLELGPVAALSVGYLHACALRVGGTVMCWGDGSDGQIGDGSTLDAFTPRAVARLADATGITTGDAHSCARLATGAVMCWGANLNGQLGDGSTAPHDAPVFVENMGDALAVAAGASHTCALVAHGEVRCWGANYAGQLGDATKIDSHVPVRVEGVTDAIAIAAGAYDTCALREGGGVRCWGANRFGEIGNGVEGGAASPPADVVGLTRVTSLALGGHDACAIDGEGAVFCWGLGDKGEHGDGTHATRSTPVRVVGIDSAISLAVGVEHACARLRDGSARCWGNNDFGKLGDGTTNASPVPVVVAPAVSAE